MLLMELIVLIPEYSRALNHTVALRHNSFPPLSVLFYVSTLKIFAALTRRRPIGRTPVSSAPPLRRRGRPLHTRSPPPLPLLPPSPRSLSLTLEHSPVGVPSLPVPSPFLPRCSPAGPCTARLHSSCRPPLWTLTPTPNPVSCTCPNRARCPPNPPSCTRPLRPCTSNPRSFCPVTTPAILTLALILLRRRGPPAPVIEREDSECLGNYPQTT